MDYDRMVKEIKTKSEVESWIPRVLDDPSMVKTLLDIVNNEKGNIRFVCTKVIRKVSEKDPEIIYPYFGRIVDLMYNSNSFIKWDGIAILSNLAKSDQESKLDSILHEYLDRIRDPQMITAAAVVGNAWKIVLAKPHFEAVITKKLLEVPDIVYYRHDEPSPECNRILCGHVIDCFDQYFSNSNYQEDILEFARGQRRSARKSVAGKAEKFLRKHSSLPIAERTKE